MRLAISAAAALVKVRHRIDEGGVPRRSSRNTREVRTCVLPVPAEADSAAWTSGSDAEAWEPSNRGNGFSLRRIGDLAGLSWRPVANRDVPNHRSRGSNERRRAAGQRA